MGMLEGEKKILKYVNIWATEKAITRVYVDLRVVVYYPTQSFYQSS
jgi:hypothetical protein